MTTAPPSIHDADRRTRLADLIARCARGEGATETPVAPLRLVHYRRPTAPLHIEQGVALWVIAQGRKRLTLADEAFEHGSDECLVVAFDLPVVTRVIEASSEEPFLGVSLALDPAEMAATATAHGAAEVRASSPDLGRGVSVQPATGDMLGAMTRLVGLLETPDDARALAPLVLEEIRYRLLTGPHRELARQIARVDPRARAVAKAVEWLRNHYTQPYALDTLTREVGMSASALHRHFRAVTAMTPLQYHKELRLREARALMLGEGLTAAAAGYRVGYTSPSQFSREYKRTFGSPPSRDIESFRASFA